MVPVFTRAQHWAFVHNRHGPKSGGAAVSFLEWGRGAGSDLNNYVAWAEAYTYLLTNWHLDPSSPLATNGP